MLNSLIPSLMIATIAPPIGIAVRYGFKANKYFFISLTSCLLMILTFALILVFMHKMQILMLGLLFFAVYSPSVIYAYWIIFQSRYERNIQTREAANVQIPRPRRMIAVSPNRIGMDSDSINRHDGSITPATSLGSSAYMGGSSATPSFGSLNAPSPVSIGPPKADITSITVLGEGVEVQADGYTYHRMGSGFNRHNNL